MSRDRLKMRKIKEVLRLRLGLGMSARNTARACGIGYGTVIDYDYRAKSAGVGWPLPEGLSEPDLERLLFPESKVKSEGRPVSDWNRIRAELNAKKSVTLALLWQEYKKAEPDGYGYSRWVELYRLWEGSHSYTMVQRHRPGEKLYVDFVGETLPITNPETGEVRQAQVFAAATGCWQYLFARVCWTQELRNWLDCHALAFEFYGGVFEVVVPDNLKAGVNKACRYEPVKNPAYAELAAHYDVVVLPARAVKPKDKAKVENGVQQIEHWVLAPLRHRTFFSLEEAQEAVDVELAKVNDRKLTGLDHSRREMFEAEEKPLLKALPASRFEYAEWRKAKIGPDYHARFDSQAYSVPHRFCGRTVEIRLTTHRVEVFLEGQIIASHERGIGPRHLSTLDEHMPASHREYAQWTPQRLSRWAAELGPCVGELVEAMLMKYVHPDPTRPRSRSTGQNLWTRAAR